MDYELGQLGARQFEHMIQALLFGTFGTSASAHGDGPDGGRDGSVKGLLAQPDLGDTEWSGYVVVQAKFHERRGTPAQDSAWFLGQLRRELALWKATSKGRYRRGEKPDYLLFATNATLSPAAGGGSQKVQAVFDEFSAEFGLKGWKVWSYSDLCRILDSYPDILKTYLGFIAPGQLIAQLMNGLDQKQPDLAAVLVSHLAKDLTSANVVRLSQMGPSGRQPVALGDVGLDLPSRIRGDESGTQGAVARIIDHCDRTRVDMVHQLASQLNFVVVGGPGQGKTTVTNLIAQAYRTALLSDANGLSGAAQQVLHSTKLRLEGEGIALPRSRRFPFRIDLASLAERFTQRGEVSLVRWIAEQVSDRGGTDMSSTAIEKMLAEWPWLVILDGLDEVAAPAIRDSIVRSITDFLEDAARHDWDVILLCTTRPQGYDGSLPSVFFRQLELEDLTDATALALANRLIELQVGDDEDLVTEVVSRVKSALKEPHTARLMRTPLQVTIMTLLLEGEPRPPRDRHTLFETYFQVIYNREVAKKGHLARLLDEQREHINAIHDIVALRLQLDAEEARDSEALMSRVDFQHLVKSYLVAEGFSEVQAQAMAGPLTTASMDRLVLLVPKGDSISFEVRSLQEYMAARRLTTGTDDEVLERLRLAAASAYWRNTILLALGRVFEWRRHLRQSLVKLPSNMDALESAAGSAALGVDLAVDMLEDGLASSSPAMRRVLIDHALTALTRPPASLPALPAVLSDLSREELINSPIVPAFNAALDTPGGPRATAVLLGRAIRQRKTPLGLRARQRTELPQSEVYGVPLKNDTLDKAVRGQLDSLAPSESACAVVKFWLRALHAVKISPLSEGLLPGLPEPSDAVLALHRNAEASLAVHLAIESLDASTWQEESAIRRILAAAEKRQQVGERLAKLCRVPPGD